MMCSCHFGVLVFRVNSLIKTIPIDEWEALMAAINLKAMDVDALLSLRADIDKRLGQKRSELEQQLSRLGSRAGDALARGWGGRRSAMKGRKVAPKYRGPGGETWAGRGARPRWLTALIKQGRKIDEFAINKSEAIRKGPVAKRSRRKKK
jgi:DNA-binding protein H-NS